jgi:Zn-dependent protease with chaperone function
MGWGFWGRSLLAALLWASTTGISPALADDETYIPYVAVQLDLDTQGGIAVSLDAPDLLDPVDTARALATSLGCVDAHFTTVLPGVADSQPFHLEGPCNPGLMRSGLLFCTHWDFATLARMMNDADVEYLYIVVRHPDLGISVFHPDWPAQKELQRGLEYQGLWRTDQLSGPLPVEITFGFPSRAPLVWFSWVGLAFVLGGSRATLLLFRRLHRQPSGDNATWFAFARGSSLVHRGSVVAWLTALLAWQIPERFIIALGHFGIMRYPAAAFVCAFPIIVNDAVLTYLRFRLWCERSGESPPRLLRLWLFYLRPLLWIGTVLGFILITDLSGDIPPDWRWGGFWVLVALLGVWVLLLARLFEWKVAAVPAGELRQNIEAMAAAAKIKFRRLSVMAGPLLGANAWVRRGPSVTYTEGLLRKLGRSEVDAVTTMEIARVKLRHHSKLSLLRMALSIAAAAVLGIAQGGLVALTSLATIGFPALALAAMLLLRFIERRLCLSRDRLAARMMEDPAKLVSALVRIADMKFEPLDRPAWQNLLVTHPSMRRRLRAIAGAANLSEEQVEAAIAAGRAPPEASYLPAPAG